MELFGLGEWCVSFPPHIRDGDGVCVVCCIGRIGTGILSKTGID